MHTTAEASIILGVQPKTVTRYILRGLIHAEKHGRDYQIEDAELERFNRDRRKPGKPRKKNASSEVQAFQSQKAGGITENHEKQRSADTSIPCQ
jgi:hypothetical protein